MGLLYIQIGGEPADLVERISNIITWHEWDVSWKPGDKGDGRGHLADISLKHGTMLNLLGKAFTVNFMDVSTLHM